MIDDLIQQPVAFGYVWLSYATTAVVLGWLALSSWWMVRSARKKLAKITQDTAEG